MQVRYRQGVVAKVNGKVGETGGVREEIGQRDEVTCKLS